VTVLVDLEMEVAADAAGIAGRSHRSDPLTSPDAIATLNRGGQCQVSVEVAVLLALAVDQEEVAVEDWVITGAQHAAGRCRDEGRTTGGDDVEAFVNTAAAARSAKLADEAARPVRPTNREDVIVERRCATTGGNRGRGWRDSRGKKNEGEKKRALQWCSMTRSTRLYSFASSALMK
jgi:hypothetical protein